jgi:hypothetical protein
VSILFSIAVSQILLDLTLVALMLSGDKVVELPHCTCTRRLIQRGGADSHPGPTYRIVDLGARLRGARRCHRIREKEHEAGGDP